MPTLMGYELDSDGFAVRNLDVDPTTGEPVSAVSRPEWNTARDYGDPYKYEAKFGRVAEGNIGEALDSAEPYEVITAAAFEAVWNRCRADLKRRWTSGGREAYEREAGLSSVGYLSMSASRRNGPGWPALEMAATRNDSPTA